MLQTVTKTRFYSPGPIFREGDRGSEMYVIRSGHVKVTKNVHGIMVRIAELGRGDHFGEMALIDGTPRSATALAEDQVEVDVYDDAALKQLIAEDPEFALNMLRAMSTRLREVDDRVTELVARGRLPHADAAHLSEHTTY